MVANYFICGMKKDLVGGGKEDAASARERKKKRETYVNLKQLLIRLDNFPVTKELKAGRFPTRASITGALGYWKCECPDH